MNILLFSLVVIVFSLVCYTIAQVTTPWYENLPAVAMDYKVHVDPGKEDCYYQYVNPGATFYVSFQVSHMKKGYTFGIENIMFFGMLFNS